MVLLLIRVLTDLSPCHLSTAYPRVETEECRETHALPAAARVAGLGGGAGDTSALGVEISEQALHARPSHTLSLSPAPSPFSACIRLENFLQARQDRIMIVSFSLWPASPYNSAPIRAEARRS